MYPAVNEFQQRRQSVSHERRFSLSPPAGESRAEGQEADAKKDGHEEDLRIMEHFARGFIERSANTDQL